MAINESLAQWFFGFAHKGPLLDAILIFLARQLPYLLILGALGYILAKQGRRERLLLFLETVLAILLSRGLLTEGIRFFYHAQRPFEAWQAAPLVTETLGNSFPSGHASFYFALATVLLFRNRPWGLVFVVFACINGAARIASGVHWPGDVLGGALLGIGSALVIHLLLARTAKALRTGTASVPPPRETLPTEPGVGAA